MTLHLPFHVHPRARMGLSLDALIAIAVVGAALLLLAPAAA